MFLSPNCMQLIPMIVWWQGCKRCHWITISQLSKKWGLLHMPSLVSMVKPKISFLSQMWPIFFQFWAWNSSLLKENNCGGAGTAGVWRLSALNEAGGWKDRTTVEDMDLAVRASLKGWKFVYLSDLKVKSVAEPLENKWRQLSLFVS